MGTKIFNSLKLPDIEDTLIFTRPDGEYKEMVVGNLSTDLHTTDQTPYNFRATPHEVGDREELEIVGCSVGWNQQLDGTAEANWSSSNATVSFSNGIATMRASAQNGYAILTARVTGEHKYLAQAKIKTTTATNKVGLAYYSINIKAAQETTAWQTIDSMTQVTNSSSTYQVRIVDKRTSDWDDVQIKDFMLFDLTLWNSTIADYVYSLEQATAGSGVAWLKHYFPKMFGGEYHPYVAHSIESVTGLSAHVMRGFNAYNHADGTAKVVGGNEYEVVGTYTSLSLDGQTITPVDGKFTPTISGILTVTGGADNTCIHLVWDGERDGQYEPYTEHSYALDDSITLRGMLKLDSNNVPYADGDVYHADGTIDVKYGVVDLGTLTWEVSNSETGVFRVSASDMKSPQGETVGNIICSKYPAVVSVNMPDKTIAKGYNTSLYLYIKDSAYIGYSAGDFKTAMSGVMLVYELATPTTSEAQPYSSPQICDNWGTEEFVSTGIVSVGHHTKYPISLRRRIEGLPDNFSNLIAPTEKTFKATRNYTSGSYLIVNNQLYKTTSAITSGATLTPNTNITATTIMAEIKALQ